ncbi:hypothetical protein CP02DC14_0927A, partial [Chlamydia psittaci 02DC14]
MRINFLGITETVSPYKFPEKPKRCAS